MGQKHISKIPQKVPGQSSVDVFFHRCFFFRSQILIDSEMTGLLYGAGAETLILVIGALRKICPRAEKKTHNNGVYPENQGKQRFGYPVLKSKP